MRTLWRDGTLYLLAEVTDPTLDDTGSDPWTQDSVEVFLDTGNAKAGPYRYDDMQVRISYADVVSFGAGDEGFQQARVDSATAVTSDGYVVEVALGLLEAGGPGTFQGLDVQVNDGTAGQRTAIRGWADPTGLGYQSTSRWGVARLSSTTVGGPSGPSRAKVKATLGGPKVGRAGRRIRLHGLVRPRRVVPTGTPVVVQQRRAGKGHQWHRSFVVELPRSGSWSHRTKLPRRAGKLVFRVQVPRTSVTKAATSHRHVVRVRKR